MKIHQAINTVEGLLNTREKKSEIKIITSLHQTLHSLDSRSLSTEERYAIEEALDNLLFRDNPESNFKKLKENRDRFMKFLREEMSLVPVGFYTTWGTSLGLCFGAALGGVLQSIYDGSNAIALGTAVGMAIGVVVGNFLDSAATSQKRVLGTRPLA